jgi:hypothetical protein
VPLDELRSNQVQLKEMMSELIPQLVRHLEYRWVQHALLDQLLE